MTFYVEALYAVQCHSPVFPQGIPSISGVDQEQWEANRRDTLNTPSFREAMSKSKRNRT